MSILAGFLSGIIGAMGMGGGAVLIIYLTLIKDTSQIKAQGINLLFFIPIAISALIIYSKKGKIKWKSTWPLAVGGLLGAGLGFFATDLIGGEILGKIFGGVLILLGIMEIFKKERKREKEDLKED